MTVLLIWAIHLAAEDNEMRCALAGSCTIRVTERWGQGDDGLDEHTWAGERREIQISLTV
jgi:hypothetical protein